MIAPTLPEGVEYVRHSVDLDVPFGARDLLEEMTVFDPAHILPSHGGAINPATATHATYDYLLNLRIQISALIEAGGDIMYAPNIDQSISDYLDEFEALAGQYAHSWPSLRW